MKQTTVSPLQLHKLRAIPTGMTEASHLSNLYLTKPEQFESVLAYAFGTTGESVIAALTGGVGNTKYINSNTYKWDLHGQDGRVIEISGAPINITANPGKGQTPIMVRFAEDFFKVTDNIVDNDGNQYRVQAVRSNGIDFIYTIVPTLADNDKWYAASNFNLGGAFSKDYSTVSEGSTDGGGTDFQAPMTLENRLTTIRKQYSITRSAATDVMVIELYSPDGSKKTRYFTQLLEWTAMAQWYQEIDRMLLISTYNSDAQGRVKLMGENQRPVYTGAGFRQQISPANKRFYAKLTYELLEDFLMELSYNASQGGGNHNFVGLTGKMGMSEFSKAMKEYTALMGITVNDTKFIGGSGSDLLLTGHYKRVEFINGINLAMKEFAPYDDTIRNRKLHPVSGRPIESYRITFMNFGTINGKANIRKVAKRDSETVMWYEGGSMSPSGVKKSISIMGSSGFDGYKVHMLAEIGIQVQDPTSCGELVMVGGNF